MGWTEAVALMARHCGTILQELKRIADALEAQNARASNTSVDSNDA